MKHLLTDQEKRVAEEIISRFDYGQIIPNEWLHKELNHPSQDVAAAQYMKLVNAYYDRLSAVTGFLLEDHQIMLANSKGKGYAVVEPKDQTGMAVAKFASTIARAGRNCVKQVSNVRVDMLTDEEKRHHADTKAAVGRLVQMQASSTLDLSMTADG